MTDLSVIIVSYNTRDLLKSCLTSVFQQKGVQFEVFVVDNGSQDGSGEMVQKDFPQAQLIKNQKNLGFAAANNQALAKAKGRYFLLLNSDTVVHGENFARMIGWMDKHSEVGVSTCCIQVGYSEGGKISPPRSPSGHLGGEERREGHLGGGLKGGSTPAGYQSVGGYFPSLGKVVLWMTFLDDLPRLNSRAYHLPPVFTEKFSQADGLKLDWVTGAYFFLRKKVYEGIGSLAEDFFMYVEEVEYCLRAKKAGWQVFFTPAASITHLGSASSTLGSRVAILGEYQSLIKLYEKHFPRWQLPLVRFWLKLGALLRFILFGYGKRNHQVRETYFQAFKIA